MMGTKTLVKNLRAAIAEGDKYHVALYGEEACRRLLQQKRALDAFESQREAARDADADSRDTEPATDDSARETAIQAENVWLREQLLDILRSAGCSEESALRMIGREVGVTDPATYVCDALDNLHAIDRDKELNMLAIENNWLREEWLGLFDALGISDAHRILDMENEFIDAPSAIVLRIVAPKPAPAMEENPVREVIRTCINCEWFVADRLHDSRGWCGDCRRYPTKAYVTETDWCGEWEER